MSKIELSTIAKINSQDIESLELDFSLVYEKVKIFYIIDTYDIIEYCFPTISFSGNKAEESMASSFLAYDFLFFYFENKPIILDEYKIELFSIWNEVHREASNLLNPNRADQIEKIKQRIKKDKENISRNIGFLLSMALGLLSDSSLIRYQKILNERLQIEKFETEDADDRIIIEQIFAETSTSKKSIKVFDKFCHESRFLLHHKTDEEKYAYLENAFRDIVVFDRIININESIQTNSKLRKKYLFLYLSSTPHKSLRIANLFKTNGFFPEIFGKKEFPILRNISQFYLKELISGSSETKKDVEAQLKECSEIIQQNNDRDNLIAQLSRSLSKELEIFNNKINLNRKELENTYLSCQSIGAYKDRILKAIENNDEIFDSEIKKIIEDLLVELDKKDKSNNRLWLTLNNYKREFIVQNKILKYISISAKNKLILSFKFSHGQDVVRSYAQLYPILLFYPSLPKKRFIPLLNFFTEIVSPTTYENGVKTSIYLDLKTFDLFNLDSYERKLYYLFLQLVIPDDIQSISSRKKYEKKITLDLIKLYEINKRRNSKYDFIKTEAKATFDVFFFPQRTFEVEVVYFLSWMYRRSQKYVEAIELLTYLIEKLENPDPRLLHSRSLCLVCEIYENHYLSKDFLIRKCQKALVDFDNALKGYQKDYDTNPNNLIIQIIASIKNTKCDIITKLFEADPDLFEDLISNEGRKLLDSFKNDLKGIGEDYINYPTYLHTEADLEFCESMIAFKNSNLDAARSKIKCAKARLNEIDRSKILGNYDYLKSTLIKVEKWDQYISGQTSLFDFNFPS